MEQETSHHSSETRDAVMRRKAEQLAWGSVTVRLPPSRSGLQNCREHWSIFDRAGFWPSPIYTSGKTWKEHSLHLLPIAQSPLVTTASDMEKILCVVFFASGLLASLADASSALLPLSMSKQQAHVLGRKGRELRDEDLSGYRHRHEVKHKEQPQVAAMEVTKSSAASTKAAGWTDEDEGARVGLIDSADYSGVAMHSPSAPPKHKHPKKP
ncbi:hypothetical protein ABZP36_004291 [Zizania latifolia]